MILTDDQIISAIYASGMVGSDYERIVIQRWSDGIEIDVPTVKLRKFVNGLLLAATPAPAPVTAGCWNPIETAPKDTEALFWVVPRTEQDEHWVDTAGNPILSSAKPRIFMGLNRCWSSLEKATHWCQLLAAPKVDG